jgi:hypothetical protein
MNFVHGGDALVTTVGEISNSQFGITLVAMINFEYTDNKFIIISLLYHKG